MDETGQFVNAVKAAELLRISYKTMLRWIKAGRVQAIEKRYDYENAEFLIPLEEVERLRAALTLSQRELVSRFLKLELDTLDMSRRLMHAEGEIRELRADLAQLHLLVTLNMGEQQAEEQGGGQGEAVAPRVRPLDLIRRPPVASQEDELLPGSIRLTAFFREHGVATTTGLDHLTKARIEPMLLDRGAKDRSKERWLSPDQQGRLIIYWDSAGKSYTRCPDCPHYVLSSANGEEEHEETSERPDEPEP